MTNEEFKNKKVVSVVPIEERRSTVMRLERISSFIKQNNLEEVTFETNTGRVRILVSKALSENLQNTNYQVLLTKVIDYHQKSLLNGLNTSIRSGGCTSIAGKAIIDLGLREMDSGVLSGGNKDSERIPFYYDLGYSYHGMNFTNINDEIYLAFDLTSHISIYGSEQKTELFAIVGRSPEEISTTLNKLTGISNWGINHR